MSDRDDSVLDRAETMARRVLERLGAKLDRKLNPEEKALSRHAVGALATRIENAIETNLQSDKNSLKRVAPNSIEILLTYEETSEVTDQYLEALAAELKVTTLEYINNRRYEVAAPIQFRLRRDLFITSTTINATFDPNLNTTSRGDSSSTPQSVARQGPVKRTIHLAIRGSGDHPIIVGPNEAPKSLGRAAGNALRIDDESVSRLHCSIALRSSGEIVVSDLGSANGTSVNGRLLATSEARVVDTGDLIVIGDVQVAITGID